MLLASSERRRRDGYRRIVARQALTYPPQDEASGHTDTDTWTSACKLYKIAYLVTFMDDNSLVTVEGDAGQRIDTSGAPVPMPLGGKPRPDELQVLRSTGEEPQRVECST